MVLIYVLSLHVKNQGRKIFWNIKNTENIRREWSGIEKGKHYMKYTLLRTLLRERIPALG